MSRSAKRKFFLRRIRDYEGKFGPISGIMETDRKNAFVEQLIDSVNRIEYVSLIKTRTLSLNRANPSSPNLFDPLLAAILKQRIGDIDEACWLIFLFTHFGRHKNGGWRYAREFYGKLGQGGLWDWATVSASPGAIQAWVDANYADLSRPGGGFGNHRKYESLNSVGNTVVSYVDWVGIPANHSNRFNSALAVAAGDAGKAFDILYKSLDSVNRFGRMAKFDYLTMIGKVGLFNITPAIAYIAGATGPKEGARLFFGDITLSPQSIEQKLADLDSFLRIGMQALEDSICNWQKNPSRYVAFRL